MCAPSRSSGPSSAERLHLNSDLDLLVEFDTTPTLFSFIRLENELSQLLGVKVDLVMKDGLKPALGTQILAEAIAV